MEFNLFLMFKFDSFYGAVIPFSYFSYFDNLIKKESWAPKNWCFWTVVLEKTLESPLDCKETQPVHPKGNQSWIFIGRTDAETLILWPSDMNSWLIGKHPDAGKDWGQEEKGVSEDEMVECHHWLNGHEVEQWSWERLRANREGGIRGWDGWMASPTQWTWVWVNSRSWWWTWRPDAVHGVTKSQTRLSNWTELNDVKVFDHHSFTVLLPSGC